MFAHNSKHRTSDNEICVAISLVDVVHQLYKISSPIIYHLGGLASSNGEGISETIRKEGKAQAGC